jgi:8-oxo-dGTP pyrophosphatase MutT (NUDIX family)
MGDLKRYSGVILKCKNKVLLCKRAKGQSLANQWSVPVGGIEKNESPDDAARREFMEETDIKLPAQIEFIDIINKYQKDGTTKDGVFFVFKSDINKEILPDLDNAEDGDEHSECRYFTTNDLPITKDNKDLMKIIKKIIK